MRPELQNDPVDGGFDGCAKLVLELLVAGLAAVLATGRRSQTFQSIHRLEIRAKICIRNLLIIRK